MSSEYKPYLPAKYEKADVAAMQALKQGIANEGQQQRALDFIINGLSRYYDLDYFPGVEGRRDSDFAAGKRFVGAQVVKMLNLKLSKIEED